MIIPTPEFDPFFADDEIPFQEKMRSYIQREFSDLIDPRQFPDLFSRTSVDSDTKPEEPSSDHRRVA